MGLNRTPIISQQRLNCATLYTFPSAMEDIGLNINERNNKVSLSHYVVLNLPKIQFEERDSSDEEKTNKIRLWKLIQDNTYRQEIGNTNVDVNRWLPVVLQNYSMNFETNIRNQGSYDFSSPKTVTERIFWKTLQKLGALHLTQDPNTKFYYENFAAEQRTIKGFGYITSSSQSSKAHMIDTETYIMIPSSYGQMHYIMKEYTDNNYMTNKSYECTNPSEQKRHLEGHLRAEEYEIGWRAAFYDDMDNRSYNVVKQSVTTGGYNNGDDVNDALEMDFSISDIKRTFNIDDLMSYDELAIKHRIAQQYDFNTILVYYTISDSLGNDVATNLYGIIILDSPQYNGEHIVGQGGLTKTTPLTINSYSKKSSNSAQFGSSYSLRLDIQTSSIYDDANSIITDISTAESSTLTDFNEVVSNLNDCVKIMRRNAVAVSNMNTVVQSTKQLAADTMESVKTIEHTVNDILHGNVRDISANDVNTTSLHVGEIIFNSEYTEGDGDDKEIVNSPIFIYGYDGEVCGKFRGTVFDYENIQSRDITSDVIRPTIIGVSPSGISVNRIGDSGEISEDSLASINQNGVLYTNDLDIDYNISEKGEDLNVADMENLNNLWETISVKKYSDKSLKLYKQGSYNEYIRSDINSISIKNLIPLMILEINQLKEKISKLERKLEENTSSGPGIIKSGNQIL